MGFYSFVVFSPEEIPLEKEHILLERGPNTFNLLVEDVEGFVKKLTSRGVRIVQRNRLDDFEPVQTFDGLPEGNGQAPQLRSPTEPGVLVQGGSTYPILVAESGTPRLGRGGVPLDGDEPEADDDAS